MSMRFYDREEEAELLRKFTRVAVIGRRRVGKTRGSAYIGLSPCKPWDPSGSATLPSS